MTDSIAAFSAISINRVTAPKPRTANPQISVSRGSPSPARLHETDARPSRDGSERSSGPARKHPAKIEPSHEFDMAPAWCGSGARPPRRGCYMTVSILAPKTDAAANSRPEGASNSPCSEAPLSASVRKAAYDRVVAFAESVTLNEGYPCPTVEVVEQQGMGLGLRLLRDVPRGGHVVCYGGPYQPIRRQRGPSRSHSLQVVDRAVPPERQDPSVIDGKVVAAIFRDPLASEAQRAAVSSIAGALINSVDEDEKRLADVKLSRADALFMAVDGVRFAAKRFTAARDLPAGTHLLWRYKINECTEPLVFADPLREQSPPTKRPRLLEHSSSSRQRRGRPPRRRWQDPCLTCRVRGHREVGCVCAVPRQ